MVAAGYRVENSTGAPVVAAHDLENTLGQRNVPESVHSIVDISENRQNRGLIRIPR